MGRVLALLAVVSVVVAACSSGSGNSGVQAGQPQPSAGQPQPPGWPAVAASLTDALDPSSPNVCNRGAAGCVEVVVNEMKRRFDQSAATCDHNAPFDLAYLFTTTGVRDLELHAPDSGGDAYLRHLDAVYAKADFVEVDDWAAGLAIPSVWKVALDAAAGRQVMGMGDLLLSTNAHITRDLAFAVAAVGTTLPDGTSAKDVFDRVNNVIATSEHPLLDQMAARFDPTAASFDLSTLGFDTASIGQLFGTWRDEAWANAVRLRAASAADRPAVAASIEASAEARGLVILAATRYVPFVTSSVSRDQFCAAHGRG
jgi:hypothetical protein